MPRPDAKQKLAATAVKSSGPSKLLIGSIIAAAALIVIVSMLVKMELDKKAVAESKPPVAASQPAQVVVKDDASGVEAYPGKAKDGAPTVDIFTDPQCPFCAAFEKQYGETLNTKAKDGLIKLVYHPMTFLDKQGKTDSQRAVGAMLCAVPSNKLIEFQQAMFQAQPEEGVGYADDTLKTLGSQNGISGDDQKSFDSCIKDGTYRKFALKLEDYASSVKYTGTDGKQATGITGTPTVLINGKQFSLAEAQKNPAALELALAEASTGEAKKAADAAVPATSSAGSTASPATSAPAATSSAATTAAASTK